MNIPNYFSRAQKQFLGLKILQFFYGDPDPGPGIFLALGRDGKVLIRDLRSYPGFVTLVIINMFLLYILFQFARSIGARAGGPPVPERGGCARGQLHLERSAAPASPLRLISFYFFIFWGDFFKFFGVIFFVLYLSLLHLPPLRFHCADEPRTVATVHWKSDALTTKLDLILIR
jgi:hypothetical protein